MPDAIKSIPWKVWLLGFLWAAAAGALPAGALLRHWLVNWGGYQIDWSSVTEVAVTGAFIGAAGYWRKYIALLQLPPELEQARELVAGVQKTETTVQTIEHQDQRPPTIITTVKETQTVPIPTTEVPKP